MTLEYPNSVYDKNNLDNAVNAAKKALDKVSANLDKRTKEGADPRCINALSGHVESAESVLAKATAALEAKNAKYADYKEWLHALNEVKTYILDKWMTVLKK
jgi:hypothetical protein